MTGMGLLFYGESPCHGCTERHVGCHGACEAYAAYRTENAEKLAKRRQIRTDEDLALTPVKHNADYRDKARLQRRSRGLK